MDALKHIKDKFKVDLNQSIVKLPINRTDGFGSLLNRLECGVGAEIGVLRGLYSKWLCHKMRGLKLFLIDPYKSYDEYSEFRDQALMDGYYETAKIRLAKYNVEFVRKFSMDAIDDFLDESLDFVYIDGNHDFEFVVRDIIEWSKKVKVGGIVAGHDYTNYMFEVRAAVDGWVSARKIKPLFLIGNKTWFYVKDKQNNPNPNP